MNKYCLITILLLLFLAITACGKKEAAPEAPVAADTVAVAETPAPQTTPDPAPQKIETPQKDSIDKWLDGMEAVVVSYEKIGSKLSVKEVFEINSKLSEMKKKKAEGKMSPDQAERLAKLIERLAALVVKTGK